MLTWDDRNFFSIKDPQTFAKIIQCPLTEEEAIKMKTFIVVGVLACIVLAQAELTEEQKKKIETFSKACLEETKVDPELVKNAEKKVYADDPKLKEYAFCFAKKANFIDEKGEVQVEYIKKKVAALNTIKPEEAEKIITKCTAKKETPQITAFESFKCFHESLPKESYLL